METQQAVDPSIWPTQDMLGRVSRGPPRFSCQPRRNSCDPNSWKLWVCEIRRRHLNARSDFIKKLCSFERRLLSFKNQPAKGQMIVGSVAGMGIVEKGPKVAAVMPFLMGILGGNK